MEVGNRVRLKVEKYPHYCCDKEGRPFVKVPKGAIGIIVRIIDPTKTGRKIYYDVDIAKDEVTFDRQVWSGHRDCTYFARPDFWRCTVEEAEMELV